MKHNFFDLLTGVDTDLINRPECKQDRTKYRAIGAAMLSTATVAFISGTFAFGTFVPSVAASLLLGSVWAATITNIDRYLVVSSRHGEGKRGLIIRLAIAIATSLVISEPTNLYIFRGEIDQEVFTMNAEQDLPAPLLDRREALETQLEILEETRRGQVDAAFAEAEGTAGSGLPGKGSLYEEKLAEAARTAERIDSVREELATVSTQLEQHEAEFTAHSPDSLLTRLQALHRLRDRDSTVAGVYGFITLFLVLIEVAPIVAKFAGSAGVYDTALAAKERADKRRYELAGALAEEQQDFDVEAQRSTMQNVRQAYHQHAQKAMLEALEDTLSTPGFADLHRSILSKALASLKIYMERVVDDAIASAKPGIELMTEDDVAFYAKSQLVSHQLDAMRFDAVTELSPPHDDEDDYTPGTLFGDLWQNGDNDNDDDHSFTHYENNNNYAATTTQTTE